MLQCAWVAVCGLGQNVSDVSHYWIIVLEILLSNIQGIYNLGSEYGHSGEMYVVFIRDTKFALLLHSPLSNSEINLISI